MAPSVHSKVYYKSFKPHFQPATVTEIGSDHNSVESYNKATNVTTKRTHMSGRDANSIWLG